MNDDFERILVFLSNLEAQDFSKRLDRLDESDSLHLVEKLNNLANLLAAQAQEQKQATEVLKRVNLLNQELEKQKALLEAVAENIPVAVFLKDAKDSFRISLWNKAAETIFGVPREAILGKTTHDLWPESEADSYHEVDVKVCREGTLVDIPFESSSTKTRGQIWLHTKKVPLRLSGDPEVDYLLALCDDVTERRQTEISHRNLAQRLQLATSAAGLGIWDWDVKRNILIWDDRMLELYGLTRETFIGGFQAWKNGLHPDERNRIYADCQAALRGEKPWDTEFRVLRPDGKIVWIKASGIVLLDANGVAERMLGINADISEKKLAEEKIRRAYHEVEAKVAERTADLNAAKKEAERANDSKSAFLANMSHEIRTPLASILGFSSLLKDCDLKKEEVHQYADTIIRNGKSLTQIIDDILDLAKVEAGKIDIETIPLSISHLTADVLDIFKDKTREKKIYLDLAVDDSIPSQICSDPTRLRQILVNLVGNAVKFTKTGGVHVLLHSTKMNDHQVKIKVDVKDSGIGITEEQKTKLFKPFAQADNSMTRKFGGTGLGLALSQRLAQALSGEITIAETSAGLGSTFCLTFIASLAKEISSPTRVSENFESMKVLSLKDLKILVVDDSADIQFLVERLLTKNGAVVQKAFDGEEAFEKAVSNSYDLILMDIQMPVMDGYQVKRALDRRGIHAPVVAFTAHAMSDEKTKTYDAGFAGHLTKPLNAVELIKTVASVCKVIH